MAHKLYANPWIQGIMVGNVQLLLSQFADDTILYLNYDLSELEAVIETLIYIENHTGLKISYEKTTVYQIGSFSNTDAKLITSKELGWSDGDVELLGVSIPNGHCAKNLYKTTIGKLKDIANNWYWCNFTLTSRVLLVNALMGSLFVYRMLVLLDLEKSELKLIDNITRKFLWKGKRLKISLRLLQNMKDTGGLHLVNFTAKQHALKISWINQIHKCEDMQYIYQWLIPLLNNKIWECNLSPTHVNSVITVKSHWRSILMNRCKYHYVQDFSGMEVREEILWLNSNICGRGNSFLNEKCIVNNVMKIADLLDNNEDRLSFDDFCTQNPNCLTWFEFMQVTQAISKI